MYDVIVIGAGPAGLTSAIYLARANKKVLVLEALTYGGQIINTNKIDNYPALPHVSGIEFATNLYNQAIELGSEIKFEKAIDIDYDKKIIKTNGNEYSAKAIIIATGSKMKKLGLPNEDKLIGRGVSYCATCDGMFFKNNDVAVIGSGDIAIEDALYLANIVNKVYLICNRDSLKGNDKQIEEINNKSNIELLLNSNITKLIGDNKLDGIEINTKGSNSNIEVVGLFVAIGNVPETNNLVRNITLSENGYIKAGEDTKTNIEGIFVAGDVREKYLRQLTTAVADGANAAVKAIEYINRT